MATSMLTRPHASPAPIQGFVAVQQNQRGTGNSQGNFTFWETAPDDEEDTITWIKLQVWCIGLSSACSFNLSSSCNSLHPVRTGAMAMSLSLVRPLTASTWKFPCARPSRRRANGQSSHSPPVMMYVAVLRFFLAFRDTINRLTHNSSHNLAALTFCFRLPGSMVRCSMHWLTHGWTACKSTAPTRPTIFPLC